MKTTRKKKKKKAAPARPRWTSVRVTPAVADLAAAVAGAMAESKGERISAGEAVRLALRREARRLGVLPKAKKKTKATA